MYEIIAYIPGWFIAGIVCLLAASEPSSRWIDLHPVARWEERTGINREFAVVPSETVGAVVGVIGGMSAYLFLGMCIALATGITTYLLGTVPEYEMYIKMAAAFAVLVGYAVQHYVSLRARKFFAWGQ